MEIGTEAARRLLLEAQGLLAGRARPATPASVEKMITRLGFVQLDSINVVARAHHLTLFSRLPGYREEHLRRLHARRRLFEHWTHDASTLPVRWLGLWHHRRERLLARPAVQRWFRRALGPRPERVLSAVLGRIRDEGPCASSDFEGPPRRGGWWAWKPAKAALEYLWWRGDLCVAERRNFEKVYDLTERAYPESATLAQPTAGEFVDWACRSALERLGVATPTELAGFWGAVRPQEARAWAREAQDTVAVRCAGRAAVAVPDWPGRLRRAERALAADDGRLRVLSPFDPVLRDRKRAERLFGFHYRFEAFTPAARRRYGYYVMPLLRGERLVGRCDAKLHRDRGELEVRGLWWERGERADPRGFAAAAEELARFVGADRVSGPARGSSR